MFLTLGQFNASGNPADLSLNKFLHIGFFDFFGGAPFVCNFYSNDLIANTPESSDVGVWHHWACTYDLASGTRTAYVDGNVITTQGGVAAFTGSGPLHVGKTFPGNVDEVCVLDSALSQTDINDVKNNGCPSEPSNEAPNAVASAVGTPAEWVPGGPQVTLDGSGSSDPDSDPLTFGWTQTGGPAATIASPSSDITTVTPSALGTYTFRLDVDDGNGGNGDDTVTVDVVDTTAPDVTAALVAIRRGDDDDDDRNHFRVEYSCSDSCDSNPATSAKINDVPVTDGQIVLLIKSKGRPKVKLGRRGVLKIKDSSFELVVTCEDESENVTEAAAVPVFPTDDDEDEHEDDEDDDDDDDEDDDDDDDDDDD